MVLVAVLDFNSWNSTPPLQRLLELALIQLKRLT
jgi:hypothetical protein